MDINYILENEELLKLLKSSMGKTYNHFKLKRIIEMEDFEQEVYLFIIPRIEKFDNKKSSLKTYIPLMVMSRAKQLIMLANGQCKDTKKSKLEFNEKILSLDYEYTTEKTTTLSDVISDNEDLINNKIDNIEGTTYSNFTDAKEYLITLNIDKPLLRLDETKKRGNSYTLNEQIYYGSAIYLTKDDTESELLISWKDDEID
jgi:hypothetical protein